GRFAQQARTTSETGYAKRAAGADPGRSDLGQGLVEAGHEALLELRRAELARGPTQPLRDDDLDVERLAVRRIQEVVSKALTLQEGVGAVDGALDDVCRLLAAEVHSVELLGARGDAQLHGEDTLVAPVAILQLGPLRRCICLS